MGGWRGGSLLQASKAHRGLCGLHGLKNRQLQKLNAGVSPLAAHGDAVSSFGRDDEALVLVKENRQRRQQIPPLRCGMTTKKTTLADVEGDSLGEREFGAVVDGVGGAAHVLLPGIGAGFAAASGFFFAAEGSADLGA
jgi:hypothetical protein